MILTNKNHKAFYAFVLYIIAFVFCIISVLKATDYAILDHSIIPHFIWLVIAMFLFIISNELYLKLHNKSIIYQMFWLNISLLVIFLLLTINGRTNLKEVGREKYIISYSIIIIGCLFMSIRSFAEVYKNLQTGNLVKIFYRGMREHIFLLFLLLISLSIAIINSGSEPRWDGAYLFNYLDNLWLASIFNINTLSFCGHIDMTYVALNLILGTLFSNLSLGMTVGNIALFLISVCCIYGILKTALKDKTDLEYTMLTAIYTFSPFLLGMVNYNYWDYWIIVIFPILIYSMIKNKWIFHFVFAFIFCFTKETAIISYGFLCAGMIVIDLFSLKRQRLSEKCRSLLKDKKYWGMLTIGGAWLWIYILLPNWDGAGEFSFKFDYIVSKLKVFFVLNFNWLLLIIAIAFLINIIFTGKREKIKFLIPILVSDVAFIVFSCLFETVNHPRYINTHIVTLLLCAIIGLGSIKNILFRYAAYIIMISLSIGSVYFTFDPLTLKVFNNYKVGNATMVSTSGEYLSDSMVYNQQYRYFDEAINLAMEEIASQDNIIMCFPLIRERSWFFDGISLRNVKDSELDTQYWDIEKRKRISKNREKNCIPIQICNLSIDGDIDEILSDQIGYYFYLPCAGEEILQLINEKAMVLEEKEFVFKGWKIIRVKFAGGQYNVNGIA